MVKHENLKVGDFVKVYANIEDTNTGDNYEIEKDNLIGKIIYKSNDILNIGEGNNYVGVEFLKPVKDVYDEWNECGGDIIGHDCMGLGKPKHCLWLETHYINKIVKTIKKTMTYKQYIKLVNEYV